MGILSWLFGRKNEQPAPQQSNQNQSLNWPETFVADDVLNCCEQIGAFEDLGITNQELINKICEDVATLFNATQKSYDALKQCFVQAFTQNGMQVTESKANLFASCYIDSYIYNM